MEEAVNDTKPEQFLEVQSFFAVTTEHSNDPPELHLVLDIEHAETGHTWRAAAKFSRHQMIDLLKLLNTVCADHKIEWRNDVWPPPSTPRVG